jgi:RNA polymerase sigma factor (sigma-70 family)
MTTTGEQTERLTEDLLLAGFSVGDEALAAAFVHRFQRTVFGVALAVIGGDGRLAEDVAQQAFERAWKHAALYDPRRGTVGAWLSRITHHLAVDTLRTRRTPPMDPSDLEDLLGAVTWTPEGAALAAETAGEVRAAIASLPIPQARALALARLWGMTAREIADAEHVPLGTVKSRIRTGLLQLHTTLESVQYVRNETVRPGATAGAPHRPL